MFFMIALTIETWIFTLIFKIQLTVGGLAGLRLQRNSLQTLYIENGQTKQVMKKVAEFLILEFM